MKTYQELLTDVRAKNPDMSFKEAQKEASRLNELQKAAPPSPPKPKAAAKPKAKAVPKAKPKPKAKKVAEKPVEDSLAEIHAGVIDLPRCKMIEREIRAKEVTEKRILKITAGNGFAVSIHKVKGGVIATAPGLRVPVNGVFEIKQ